MIYVIHDLDLWFILAICDLLWFIMLILVILLIYCILYEIPGSVQPFECNLKELDWLATNCGSILDLFLFVSILLGIITGCCHITLPEFILVSAYQCHLIWYLPQWLIHEIKEKHTHCVVSITTSYLVS